MAHLAAGHADDFGVGRAAVPETEQHEVGALEDDFVGPLATVVENILVQQEAETVDRDAQNQGGFGFAIELLKGRVGSRHRVVRLPGAKCLYLLGRGAPIR